MSIRITYAVDSPEGLREAFLQSIQKRIDMAQAAADLTRTQRIKREKRAVVEELKSLRAYWEHLAIEVVTPEPVPEAVG